MALRKWLWFVLLLPVGAFAQTSPRFDSLQVTVLRQMNVDLTGANAIYTTAAAKAAINRAQRQVARDFPAYEKLDTVTAIASRGGFTLNADYLRLRSVFRMLSDTTKLPLEPAIEDQLYKLGGGKTGANAPDEDVSKPRYYYTHGNLLFVYPDFTDDDSVSFLVYYYALPPNLSSASDTTLVRHEYRESIVDYAVGTLFSMGYQYNDATWYLNRYGAARGVPPMKEEQGRK